MGLPRALTVLSGVAAVLFAASPALATPPDLAGTTTVSGQATQMVVRVPATATLSLASLSNPDVAFTTASPKLAGVLIRQWPTPSTGFARDILLLHRALPCSACDPQAPTGGVAESGGTTTDDTNFQTGTLPPGLYTLQLIGNDELSVRLHLHGLDGEIALNPTEPAVQEVKALPLRAPWPGNGFAPFGADGVIHAGGNGELITDRVVRYPAPAAHVSDTCFYEGATANDPSAFAPGCPTSAVDLPQVGAVISATPLVVYSWASTGGPATGPGTWGIGGNETGLIDGIDAQGVWLTLTDPPAN